MDLEDHKREYFVQKGRLLGLLNLMILWDRLCISFLGTTVITLEKKLLLEKKLTLLNGFRVRRFHMSYLLGNEALHYFNKKH